MLGCSKDYYTSFKAFEYYTSCNKEVFADGITFSASVRGGDEQAALDEMLKLMDEINSQMSLTVEDSALARFNAIGNDVAWDDNEKYESERVEISEYTAEVIELSKQLYEETDGAFNIAVYSLAELWHVDTDGLGEYGLAGSQENPSLPSKSQIETLLGACDLDKLILHKDNGKYFISKTDPRLKIDLGAIAKGYAADKCVEIAEFYGAESAMINISGNICVLGEWYHPEQKKYVRWQIGVTSPRPRGGMSGNLCALSAPANKTFVTSGDYVRYYQTLSDSGETLFVPHIVSGKSGMPLGVEPYGETYKNSLGHVISATVICEDSAKADAYATAVCVMGMTEGTEFLRSRGIGGILVSEDGKMNLIDVSESDESGEIYFTLKDNFSAYKKYAIEEFAIE